jgi:hypothetical protein
MKCSYRRFLPCAVAIGALAVPAAKADSYSATVLADNPAAYYRFEEQAGEVMAKDSSASGAYGGALMFDNFAYYPKLGEVGIQTNSARFHPFMADGVLQKSYIEVPYAPELNATGAFSVEAWARSTSFPPAGVWRSPVCNFGGWGDSSGWHFYQSPAAPDSTWIWVQKGGGIWLGGVPVTKGKWDYLAAIYDGKTVTFYVNGVSSGSSDASTALPNSGQPFCIGGDPAGNWWFDGNVDEVAIYTNALTVAQLQKHYEVGRTNFDTRAIPAAVLEDPVSATAYAGHEVTFVAGADGTAPLAFQWYKGTAAIAGATTDTLMFTCAYADNNTTYKCIVTNQYGSATSAQATLTVSTDLQLVKSPDSITRTVGSKAAFRVEPLGAFPVSYQWYKDTTAIPGETNATLWLSGLTLAENNSTYYAKVSNPWSTTNSDPATLSVNARSVTIPMTGYAKVIQADDPVGYWRLNEADASVATDAIGSFDGTFDDNGGSGTFTFGLPTGIPHETDKALSVTNKARIAVDYALELNPVGPFTAEAWFQPSSVAADEGDYRTAFASMGNGVGGPIGWLLYQTPANQWVWVVFADNWISSFMPDPVDTVVANNWYHIALAYDGKLFKIFVNGRLTYSQTYDIFVPNLNGKVNFGWRPDNDWKPFAGTIDDVAFYNKALTLEQVQTHFNATVRLTQTMSGNNIVLSWPFGTLQEAPAVEGSYTDIQTATSPYTNAPSATAKFYRIKVQ